MNKLLSIIVPSYNMEKYLKKCLCSLIVDDEKLLQKLDVIVVNDGSKDHTSTIAHEFESKYPEVFRVIDKLNGNYGSCVNAGLDKANGVFVRVLDADDYQNTKIWQKYLVAIMGLVDSEVDLILSLYSEVDEDGAQFKVSQSFSVPEHQLFDPDVFDDMSPRIDLHNLTYRTKRVKALQYRQTEGVSYTDTEWITTPMVNVRKAYYMPEIVTCYLVGRAGQTMDKSTYAHKFDVVVKLVAGLCSIYDKMLEKSTPAGAEIYKRQLMQSVRMVYSALVLRTPDFKCTGNLRWFTKTLRDRSPYWYKWADQYIVPSNHFPIRAFHEYHVWHTIYSPRLIAYSLYRAIVRIFA